MIDRKRAARGVVPSTETGRGSHTKGNSSRAMLADGFDSVKCGFSADAPQNSFMEDDSEDNYWPGQKESLAKKPIHRYNKGKTNVFFAENVFPPYNESRSDSHEVAERWARSEDTSSGDQKLISHRGKWYVVEAFTDMKYGYQITESITEEEYGRRSKQYDTIAGYESLQDSLNKVLQDQWTLHTDKALSYLKFIEAKEIR